MFTDPTFWITVAALTLWLNLGLIIALYQTGNL